MPAARSSAHAGATPRGAYAPGAAQRATPGSTAAGQLLLVLGVLPALAVAAWLAVAFGLLLVDAYRPLPALLLGLPAAGLAAAVAARGLRPVPVPWWVAASVLTLGAAVTALSVYAHAEWVLVLRDPAPYALAGHWYGSQGSLPIPVDPAAFGGSLAGLRLDSPGTFPVEGGVVPEFMTGHPLLLAVGWWLGGWTGLLIVPAVVGGLGVIALACVAVRLVGASWAPLTALAVACCYPFLLVARATYSEPLALLLLAAALTVLLDVAAGRAAPLAAAVGGFTFGVLLLVRIDALREWAFVAIGVALLARRGTAVRWYVLGWIAGAAIGLLDGFTLALPYLDRNKPSVLGAAVLCVAAVAVAVGVGTGRPRWAHALPARLPAQWRGEAARLTPALAAGAVVLVALFLLSRPLWLVDRMGRNTFTEAVQYEEGLPIDGTRSYDERSVEWLAWWVGWPTLALAAVGAALLAYRVVGGGGHPWLPLLPLLLGSPALTLWRPAITPDHPWWTRRFVVVAIPALALLAAWAVREAVRRCPPGTLRAVVASVGVLALVVPPAVATAPLATTATERGSLAAVERACAAFRPGDTAIVLDELTWVRWLPVLRDPCGVPVAFLEPYGRGRLAAVVDRVRAAGRTPVLVAASSPGRITDLPAAGLPVHVLTLETTEDARRIVARPSAPRPLVLDLWVARVR